MAVTRKTKEIKPPMGFLVYGKQGTWKSSMALECCKFINPDTNKPFRLLYIDAEMRSVDGFLPKYEKEGINLDNILIIATQSVHEVRDLIKQARNDEPFHYTDDYGNPTDEVVLDGDGKSFKVDMIIIDGTTLLHSAREQSLLVFSKKRATVKARKLDLKGTAAEVAVEGADLEFKDYKKLGFDGTGLIIDLMASGKHFLVTSREKAETIGVKDEKGNMQRIETGRFLPSGFKDMEYNVQTVIHTYEDELEGVKAIIESKDRTEVFSPNDILLTPSVLYWQEFLNSSKGKSEKMLHISLDEAVEKETKSLMEQDEKETQSEANIEEIDLQEPKEMTATQYKQAISKRLKEMTTAEKQCLKSMLLEHNLSDKLSILSKEKDTNVLVQYYNIMMSI